MADWLWDVVVFAVPLVVYTAMLAPSVLPGDSGEFQFAAPTLSIPHPTGYPLYLLLGKLFSALPIGNTAYRINLLSAVAAAGAVWATYRAGQALNQRRAASLVGASLDIASGMDTISTDPGDPEYVPDLDFFPVEARYIKIYGVEGQDPFAVSELQIFGQELPPIRISF